MIDWSTRVEMPSVARVDSAKLKAGQVLSAWIRILASDESGGKAAFELRIGD